MNNVVVTNGLRPPLDEAGTATVVRLVESLEGPVTVVNRAPSPFPFTDPTVRSLHVPRGTTRLASAASYLRFLALSLRAARRDGGARVHYVPLCSPSVLHQVHALSLSLAGEQMTELLFQLEPLGRIARLASRFSIRTTSPTDLEELRQAGLDARLMDPSPARPKRSAYDRGALRREFGLSPDRLVVSHVGHLTDGRGIDFLVRLAERNPDIEVLLVLSSRRPVTLRNLPANCRLLNRFVDDIYDVYWASDAYIFPLRDPRFAVSTPLSLLEAMLVGLPLICSDLPNVRETLRDYDRVFFLNMSDEEEALRQASDSLAAIGGPR